MPELKMIPEPTLLFGHGQAVEDPRDGITLFGPLDNNRPTGVSYGVVGTPDGIRRMQDWVKQIHSPILDDPPSPLRPPFPGFEAAFGIPWRVQPTLTLNVTEAELSKTVHIGDRYQRVYQTVDLFASRIIKAIREEEENVDIWFVIITEDVYRYCRPNSTVLKADRVQAVGAMKPKIAQSYRSSPSLFEEDNQAAIPYQFDVNFHNQLKARLLEHNALTQVLRESTLAPNDFLNRAGYPLRRVDASSTIAWNICAATYYKVGGRPWKIGAIRDGVCYIGLVFKQDQNSKDPRSSCCAAQMFLDDGDGVVFKGAVGPWHTLGRGDFHLTYEAAKQLITIALVAYQEKKGCPPKELFIHGRVRFNEEEWAGFCNAATSATRLVGVRITSERSLKIFSRGDRPILRGLAYIRDERTAFLWTKGYIPRLKTYPGMEVPNPLMIDVCRGTADIETVLQDILALTKLNYNACIFADGEPVTIKFADAVGEILTAGPVVSQPPLPFKYYI